MGRAYLPYTTACGCLNFTYITVSHDNVEVDQRPLKLCSRSRTTQFNKSGHEDIRVKRRLDNFSTRVQITYELDLGGTRTGSSTNVPV